MTDISKIDIDRIEGLNDVLDNCLNKHQITNCITEIPQDIKLELVDGVLTLKAGSKVYIPNGFEEDGTTNKFDEVVIESDLTSSSRNYDLTNVMVIQNSAIKPDRIDYVFSGATTPSNPLDGYTWYDTTNNIIKVYEKGSWSTNSTSFPFAITTSTTANSYTSIDQVFNGFGYIGSTVFMLDGTKGFAPNGRNADGSLNNTEVICRGVSVHSTSSAGTYFVHIKPNIAARFAGIDTHFEQNEKPTVSTTYASWYSPVENKFRFTNDRGVTWIDTIGFVNCITITTTTNGKITSFTPKLPFRAVDYNDIFRMIMPDYTKGVNKGNSFISDGYYLMYVTQTFSSTGSVAVTITINGVSKTYDSGGNWGSWVCPFYLKPGDIVSLSTSGSGISETCYPLGMN